MPSANRMKNHFPYILHFTILLWMLMAVAPSESVGWMGVEFDSRLTGIADPYEVLEPEGDGGMWELSGRIMYQESFENLDAEVHWLATALGSFGEIDTPVPFGSNPFRSLDLEGTHYTGDKTAIVSELDRLSLTLNMKDINLTIGRQAVSWGEAYYYNIGDLFGAFPITETNRIYKTGIDALAATMSLGSFSDLSLVFVPTDEEEDNVAARLLFPVGSGSLTLMMGSILESNEGGAGYTIDVKGTKLYGTWLFTDPEDGDRYSELVLGTERQTGPYTHIVGELFYNGWGSDDPDEYINLLLTDRYLNGQALALGSWNGAVQVSRQMSALLTITPAVFTNLSDGSALLRIDGSFSASDLTSVSGGVFLGLGDRPDGLIPASEFGSVPTTIYIEVVHSL